MPASASPDPTFYLSGVHSGPNPSPGLGIARSLRDAFPRSRIVGVDYSVESSGLHSQVFDEVWVQRPWKELRLPVYGAAVQEVLNGGAFWIPGQDLEVEWLSQALNDPSRALIPGRGALQRVAKPTIDAARNLPFSIPEFVLIDLPDWDLHAFCRDHGWRVWMKGPNYEAYRVVDWPSFRAARHGMGELWGTDQLFVQRHVPGNEESVALCAYQGELLDCVHLRKHTQTHEGKTWAGQVSAVEPALLEGLRETIAELEWTGGAELEYVRSADGRMHLIDWNPRFPAWIHAASFAGHNLPARLVEAAGAGSPAPESYQGSQFTRVVMEVPVRGTHPLPPVRDAMSDWRVGSKHPSGMTDLSRRLAEGAAGADPARRAAARSAVEAVPEPLRRDLDAGLGWEISTPRRILLPSTARERFSRVEAAMGNQVAAVEVGFGYSVKTNPHPSLIALAERAGMLAEVISAAELRLALGAGFPPERVILNGPAQQWGADRLPDEPLMAAFADSPQTLRRWLDGGGPEARYRGLRLRPVTIDSRFGASLRNPKRFAEILALLRALPADQALGLHFHFASDVLGPSRWKEVYAGVVHWADAIQQGTGRAVRCLDVGGGWFPEDFDRALLVWLDDLVSQAADLLPGLERFLVEPGKAIAQPTMALASTVLEVRPGKHGSEVVMDAAISDLPMAPFYPHRVYASRNGDGWVRVGSGKDRLLGRICMETDVLVSDLALPASLREGDRLVIGDAGGYDASMAYNFGRGVVNDSCC